MGGKLLLEANYCPMMENIFVIHQTEYHLTQFFNNFTPNSAKV